jgi:hypothetical protein
VVRGNNSHRDRSTLLRADFALFHKPNIPLAVVEPKDNTLATSALEQTLTLDQFHSPIEIWARYCSRAKPRPARYGHRHRQNLHRVLNHLAVEQARCQKPHPVFDRPQRTGPPNHG